MIAALLGEGTSDRALLPILRWLLGCTSMAEVRLEWIDTSRFVQRSRTLASKVTSARMVCPWDLLFVHRDADNQPSEWRYEEIRQSAGSDTHVAVVPIRTTEAWLLFDEGAIRAASGRVTGTDPLDLPALTKLEAEPDPKHILHNALSQAHGTTGRRARRFEPAAAVHRLADLVEDWSPLRQLSAFQRLEADTRAAVASLGLPLLPPVD